MTSERKLSHLEICRDLDVSYAKSTHLEDIELMHVATPELDLESVDLSVKAFGKKLSAPVIISAMTGGHPDTERINRNLAEAARDLGVGMGVGSQRAALEEQSLEGTFRVVRDVSSDMLIIANLGAAQLLSADAVDLASKAIDMIDADAIAIHLNPLQELVQPNGDTRYKGVLDTIRRLSEALAEPIIVKETGCGLSREVAVKLLDAGALALDVSGAGGTSWAAVEHHNACLQGDDFKADIANTFREWGIPTAMSLCEVASITPTPLIIASGGVKSGIDMAKTISMGASIAGVARPLLIPAFEGPEKVKGMLSRLIYELRSAAMLTGSKNVAELKHASSIMKGELLEWAVQRRLAKVADTR